jgi:hypothetical protein
MTMYFTMGFGGWTESFYSGLSVPAAITAGRALAAKRAMLMVDVSRVWLVGARDLDNPRVAAADWDLPGFDGTAGGTYTRDLYNAAEQIKLTGGMHDSKPWLHALPDQWMEANAGSPYFKLTGNAALAIDAYLAFIVAQGVWQIRALTAGITPATPKVKSFTYAGGVLTCVIPGTTLVEGDLVLINSCKGWRASQFNGLWKVKGVTVDSVVLSGKKALTTEFQYVDFSGVARRQNKIDFGLFTITAGQRIKVGARKIGRPTSAPHGRQSRAR